MHYGDQHTILLLSIEFDCRLLELLKIYKNIIERIHFKGLSASFLSILPSHCASYTMISSYHFPSTYVAFGLCKLLTWQAQHVRALMVDRLVRWIRTTTLGTSVVIMIVT